MFYEKKNREKILTVGLGLGLVLTNVHSVQATCMPEYRWICDIRPNYPDSLQKPTSVAADMTSKSGAHVADTYAQFNTLQSIPTTFKSSSSRTAWVYLFDDDGKAQDDLLKKYTGKFTGRKLSSMSYSERIDKDEYVDGKNDRTAELYLIANCSYISGDPTTTSIKHLFKYRTGIN